jgi:hypothetical protein
MKVSWPMAQMRARSLPRRGDSAASTHVCVT